MSATLSELKRKRGYLFGFFTKNSTKAEVIFEKGKDDLTTDDLTSLETMLRIIPDKLKEIIIINDQIIQAANEDDIDAEMETIDEKDFEFRMLQLKLEKFVAKNSSDNPTENYDGTESVHSQTASNLKLPKFDLPKFDGKYQNWTPFLDLFKGAVDSNDTLPDIQKLHYLKASLRDEPAKLLSHLPITGANYKVAMKLLKERYENKRLISLAHIDAILNFKPLNQESPESIRSLISCYVENAMALDELVKTEDQLSCFLVRVISQKLDYVTRRQWELTSTGDDIQTMDQLKKFLEERANALEAAGKSNKTSNQEKIHQEKPIQNYHASSQNCPACKADHKLVMCEQFKHLSLAEKREKVKLLKLCFNCLRLGHQTKDCKSKNTCRKCQKKHHTMLHDDTFAKPTEKTQSNHSTERGYGFCTLLPTAMIKVISADNTVISCRALLDSGSQSSFITENCAQLLKLKRQKHMLQLTGIGDKTQKTPTASTKFQFLSSINTEKRFEVKAFILPKLAATMPAVNKPKHKPLPIEVTPLADSDYLKPRNIDIILGADIFEEVVLQDKIKTPEGLYFRKTEFGWVAAGQVPSEENRPTQSYHVTSEFDLRKFWELEELPKQNILTKKEVACEQHFETTTTRDQEGRFIVKLPFKQEVPKLGDSFEQAKRRFLSLERRLQANPNTQQKYKAFVQEFIDLEHLEKVPGTAMEKLPHQVFYLPHHCVFKDDSSTTKLRVVFDGSAKSQSGISLNESLMVGATVQPDFFSTLLRFRFHRVAISGDVAKMYRQVGLNEADKDFHRILWRDDTSKPIQHYRMTRVTYGITSSAHHSTRCLKKIGELSGDTLFSTSIQNDFYVDDYLSGAPSIQEARSLLRGISAELQKFGFELRKWTSNEPEIILELPKHLRENTDDDKVLDKNYHIKTLGVKWRPNLDEFHFQINLDPIQTFTKRIFLSDLSKLFDPLGWLAPVVIKYKILMQQTWTTGSKWDETLPDEILSSWMQLRSELPLLNSIQLPRCILLPSDCTNFELHLFTDASETAYAAVVYSRTVDLQNNVSIKILALKSRVAPVKTVSLPRLELCAALLGSKLIKTITDLLSLTAFRNYTVFAWSDSTIVLQWLSQPPNKWTTFVANRISQIQDIISPQQWNHVPTASNPADIPTRGMTPKELLDCSLWWSGPKWLHNSSSAWPKMPTQLDSPPEQKKQPRTDTSSYVASNASCDFIIDTHRFSNPNHLYNALTYVYKAKDQFLFLLNKQNERPEVAISFQDIQISKFHIVSRLQQEFFSSEYNLLKQNKALPPMSHLKNLSPFWDATFDVIRVGGRLSQSTYSDNKKFPVLLPKTCHFTTLVIRHFHEGSLHGGGQLTLNLIRQEYWPISGKQQVNSYIKNCITCQRFSAKPPIQLMADLPSERITPSKPFTYTGLDFAGPIITEPDIKTYIAVFVCFSVKATHLELVSSLTKEACLNPLQRFSSRRGVPQRIYTDNATNFIGARNDLLKIQDLLEKGKQSIRSFGSEHGTEWVMIPPRAPHFG